MVANQINSRQDLSNFIWQIADLLRGPYRPPQYERVMLPMVVLRRFDCVLEPTKEKVLVRYERLKDGEVKGDALDSLLNKVAGPGFRFHNRSPLTFETLKGDPDHIDKHLVSYINGFSANVRRIFEYFEFSNEIEKMQEANILYLIVSKFCDVDLGRLENDEMGFLFENLIHRFNELANETAGDHFTPREVIDLMVDLMFDPDDDLLSKPGTVRTLLDPTCGTGGMLAEAQKYLYENHSKAELYVFGQDFNPRAYAIAASDMLIKGHEKNKIEFGDSLIDDKFAGEKFSYFLANPPFGVDWKKQQKEVTREHEKLRFAGRFGAGLPRVNDGSFLFLQHMIDKFEPVRPQEQQYGSRLAIVFNGSPLFTGSAGSGESNIRKWIIESDWLEAIVALPEQMFYNTGIGTYVWLVTNRKQKERKGKIQLIDARARWKPMRRSMGDKRRYLGDDDISSVVREYGVFVETETSKIFDNIDFGYTRVTVERPLRLRFRIDAQRKSHFLDAYAHLLDDVQAIDAALGREDYFDWNAVLERVQDVLKGNDSRWRAPELRLFRSVFTERDPSAAAVVAKREPVNRRHTLNEADRFGGWFPDTFEADGEVTLPLGFSVRHQKVAARVHFEPDPELRDFENIPLKVDIDNYFRREVLPYVPDAWMDREKDKVGYEINFNHHFYRFVPPRPLDKIDADLRSSELQIVRLLREVTA